METFVFGRLLKSEYFKNNFFCGWDILLVSSRKMIGAKTPTTFNATEKKLFFATKQ